ncbi:MAG: hypothetical protein ACAH83_06090 [Alphaproteobacteria bacterium]
MADTGNMTKEQLKDHIQRLGTREAIAALVMMAAGAGLLFSSFAASLGVAALCFTVVATSGATLFATTLKRQRCESDQMRRYPPPPGQVITRNAPAQEPPISFPAAANDFNPAAATTLEKDIKPMAPLRLNLKP